MKKLFTLLFFIFVCVLVLSCCHSKTVGHRIVGVWEHAGNRIEFSDNGYYKKGDQKYPYTVTEDKITIDKEGEALVVNYTINPNGTLTMNGMIYYPVNKKHK